MTTPPPHFGALLKSLRTAAGLTQETLAERARLSRRGLQDLERGVHQTPRRDTVELLATALGLSAHSRMEFLAVAQGQFLPPADPPASATLLGFSSDAPLPLVGREREVALLGAFLAGVHPASAVGAEARVLLLAGEPGAGKTRLLQAVAQQAIATGWSVLASGCQRRGGQDPYAPLLDALAEYLQLQRSERRGADLAGCAWLVRLLPELEGVVDPLPAGKLQPEQERRLMYAAIARFLVNVAGPAGTLLVLDDLQWAGPDALDLLLALARRAALPLRIVGAYRDTEVRPADPLGVLLADLAHTRLGQPLPVGALTQEAAAMLLADLLAGVAGGELPGAAAVLRRAGGMPFYLVSYAQALATGAPDAVPWDVAQGVRQRIAQLPEPARQVLGEAAVVGRHVTRTLLMAIAGLAEEEVLAGLEAACHARLLLEDGDDAYAFAHDVIRDVVEADLGAARRAMLHRRVAEALEGAPTEASTELLTYHYARSGDTDKAVQYLELAGDHALAQQAYGAAESHYREVVDRLDRLGRARDTGQVRQKLGMALYRAGHYEASLSVFEQAAATYQTAGDWESVVRATAWIGRTHAVRGTPHEGIACLTALLERLDQGDTALPLALLHAELGRLLFAAGRYRASLAASERAAELARAGGDDRIRLRAEGSRANILNLLGRLGDALRLTQEVLPLQEAAGDLYGLLLTHRDLAYIHALYGAFAPCQRHIDHALDLARQIGDPASLASTLALRGWFALLRGDMQGARADLAQAVALSRQVDRSWHVTYALICRARLSLVESAEAEATALAQEALALAERSGDLQALRWASGVLAELEVRAGCPEAAIMRLTPLLDRPGLEECDVTQVLPVLAWAYLEQGQVAQAADSIEQALTRARREQMRLVLAEALRVQTMVELRREQWEEAAHSVAEGQALACAMPYPYAEARLLHVEGTLHARQGAPEAAQERLEAAHAIFQHLGARDEAARAEHDMAALLSCSSPAAPHHTVPSAQAAAHNPAPR